MQRLDRCPLALATAVLAQYERCGMRGVAVSPLWPASGVAARRAPRLLCRSQCLPRARSAATSTPVSRSHARPKGRVASACLRARPPRTRGESAACGGDEHAQHVFDRHAVRGEFECVLLSREQFGSSRDVVDHHAHRPGRLGADSVSRRAGGGSSHAGSTHYVSQHERAREHECRTDRPLQASIPFCSRSIGCRAIPASRAFGASSTTRCRCSSTSCFSPRRAYGRQRVPHAGAKSGCAAD